MLNLGDVYFSVLNRVSETRRSCEETEAVINQMRDRVSRPIVIPVSFSHGGMGGWGSPAGAGGGTPTGGGGWTPTGGSWTPTGSGWGSSGGSGQGAGPAGTQAGAPAGGFGIVLAGGLVSTMASPVVRDNGSPGSYANSAPQFAGGRQGLLGDGNRVFVSSSRVVDGDGGGGVRGPLLLGDGGGGNYDQWGAGGGGGRGGGADIDAIWNGFSPRDGGRGGGGRDRGGNQLIRGLSNYMLTRAITGAVTVAGQAFVSNMDYASDMATFGDDPMRQYSAMMKRQQDMERAARVMPAGVGEAGIMLRDVWETLHGRGKADISREMELDTKSMASYEGMAGARKEVRLQTIRANTMYDPIERDRQVRNEQQGAYLSTIQAPFNEQIKTLREREAADEVAVNKDSIAAGLFGGGITPGAREAKLKALRDQLVIDVGAVEASRTTAFKTATTAYAAETANDPVLMALRSAGVRGEGNVYRAQLGLDPEAQRRGEWEALTTEQQQKMGHVAPADREELRKTQEAERELMIQRHALSREEVKITDEQIRRSIDVMELQGKGLPLEARRVELLNASVHAEEEVQAKRRTGATVTDTDLITERAAKAAYASFVNEERPRIERGMIMPLQAIGGSQGLQMQGAEALLAKNYPLANLRASQAAAASTLNEGLIDLQQTTEPSLIPQKAKNLQGAVSLMQMAIKTRFAGGYGGTEDPYQVQAEGYRNQGKEENFQAMLQWLEKIHGVIARAASGEKGLLLGP